MSDKIFAVAVDGPSGAGKSTLAKAVAAELGIVYVDKIGRASCRERV